MKNLVLLSVGFFAGIIVAMFIVEIDMVVEEVNDWLD